MKDKALLFLGIIFLLLALAGGFGFYYLNAQKIQAPETGSLPSPAMVSDTETTTIQETEPTPAAAIPAGWQTYTNAEYGFQIAYPAAYQALDDATNLYGWPNGLVLFYKDGQSYDLAVEVWNTQAEYQAKYQNQTGNLTVKNLNNQFLTLLNTNSDPEVDQIIATFTSN